MSNKQKKLNTGELLNLLHESDSFDDVLNTHSASLDDPTPGSYLMNLLHENGYTPAILIERTNLSKSFIYQILNGTRTPSRDILLRIALVIGLNLDQTQKLLTVSHRGSLYPRIRRDAAIIFCFHKKSTLEQANELLEGIGEIPLIAGSMDE